MLMPRAPHLLISMMVSHFAPSKAIAWIWHMSGKSFSLPAAFMQVITSWVGLGLGFGLGLGLGSELGVGLGLWLGSRLRLGLA